MIGVQKLTKILEWVVETTGDIDFYDTEDMDFIWNIKYLELAGSCYLALAFYGGRNDRYQLFEVGEEDPWEISSVEIAKSVLEKVSGSSCNSFIFIDTETKEWGKLMSDMKEISLRKTLGKRKD